MSQLRDAQRFIAPCHLLRKGSLLALWCRVRTLPGYSPWPSTLFTAYTSTNSSALSPSSRRDCVQSSRHVPLSSRCTDRTALSISVTTRPPSLAAFYVFPGRVVNPVTREPQHLDDGDPYRTHMRPRFTLRRPRGRVCRARHAPELFNLVAQYDRPDGISASIRGQSGPGALPVEISDRDAIR